MLTPPSTYSVEPESRRAYGVARNAHVKPTSMMSTSSPSGARCAASFSSRSKSLRPDAARVFSAMFDLSQTVDLHRLPELICGFYRRPGGSPTLYPVACAPQAWAAGAVYLLLQACLGLRVEALAPRVSFTHAVLPEEIEWLRIVNLSVRSARLDLLLTRHANDVGVTVLRREGAVEIITAK